MRHQSRRRGLQAIAPGLCHVRQGPSIHFPFSLNISAPFSVHVVLAVLQCAPVVSKPPLPPKKCAQHGGHDSPPNMHTQGAPEAQCARSATIWAFGRTGDPCFEILGASLLPRGIGFDAFSTLGMWHFWIFTQSHPFPPFFTLFCSSPPHPLFSRRDRWAHTGPVFWLFRSPTPMGSLKRRRLILNTPGVYIKLRLPLTVLATSFGFVRWLLGHRRMSSFGIAKG